MAAFHYITITTLLFHLYGSGLGEEVKQFPPSVLQHQDNSTTLTCLHTYSSYNTMLWYKQSQDGGLQLLGYLTGTAESLEKEFKDSVPKKIEMKGNAMVNNNASLVINKLVPSDKVNMCKASLFTLSLLWLTGSSLGQTVEQTPSDLIKSEGKSVKINCLHTIKDYNVILWYCQKDRGAYTLMGYLFVTQVNREKAFESQIQLDGNADTNKENSLTINSLSPNHSAVYFCAASRHSDTSHLHSEQKPQFLPPPYMHVLLQPC
ncbi:uncharacterized protein LOC134068045 [Sardina pilchardus]|uniref:uncharacterized protein LOC134068045 n=1 Tax=Sardina pilchardus TaxID=27697 RepID=UPI002E1486CA